MDAILAMSCIDIPEPLARLLDTLANHYPAALDPAAVILALSYGWVCKFEGKVALTGAGAYHAGRERAVGLLE